MFGLFRRRKDHQITIGTRYRAAETPLLTWEVASIFTGIDGQAYAQIFCVTDQTRRKTVAQSALEHGVQYIRLPA